MRTNQRGSSLAVTMIVVVVVSVIGIGILKFTSRELYGSMAGQREQSMVACAESSRALLMSKFHALGIKPLDVAALNVPIDSNATSQGGHYDMPSATSADLTSIQLAQVTYLSDSAFGPLQSAFDLTNTLSLSRGGRPMKVMVRCINRNGIQLEVEFGIKFGL
ncbi:MAG TPA: hypothetical protein VLU43_08080 [Anaeromyxobacteraceae bacterium]|nr:hypothetical protein [Anaeromyxobacteraceae bacterium]